MYDVIIVGCGITGAALAYELSKYKLNIAVLEKENDVAQGATKANSAIIHAGYDPKPGTLMAKLNVRGAELAKKLCEKLDVPYRQNGAMVVAMSDADVDTLKMLYDRGIANGVQGIEIISGDYAREKEPELSDMVTAALYVPTSAICLPWEYCLALAETAVVNGAEVIMNREVTGLNKIDRGWQVETDKGTLNARYVINAAGVEAGNIHKMVSEPKWNILPTRGEYYLMDKDEGDRVNHTIFQCPGKEGKGVLVSPTVHGNLLVGPNAEAVEGQDVSTTYKGLSGVAAAGLKSVPTVNFRQSIRNFAGVRANNDTGDFIIGEVEGADGFFDAAGICSPGLSAAPAIAEYIAELLGNAGLCLERKENFIDRRSRIKFKNLSAEEKNEIIKKNPAYGRVVCRCETVTEGEILDAIHRCIPPCSVDGVKRRVGAGLGRCQGGFCGPRVVELLSRELDVEYGNILQDKEGSYMLAEQTK